MTDVAALWDFDDPAGSQARFQAAADQANGAERAILQTQVARALGLQERYDEAHALLDSLHSDDAEVEARILLERGRAYRSAGDPASAAPLFSQAARVAQEAGLGGLWIDALHMSALVAPAEDQRRLTEEALTLARASADPAARAWEGSLLHNLGMTLVDAGDLDPALVAFAEALAVREREGDVPRARIARWTVGWVHRLAGRHEEARRVQQDLLDELTAAGEKDPYVEEELALLDTEEQP